jgi:DNA polymerase-3 subunit delta
LQGEEPFFTDEVEACIRENALEPSERAFNETIVYGKDTNAAPLLDQLRRYPILAARQLVVLREAQEMREFDQLLPYLEQAVPTTVFVVCFKKKRLDLKTSAGKAMKNNAVVFESKKLYDNQIAEWITLRVRAGGGKIDAVAAQLMAEYLGTDLGRVAGELEKLQVNVPPAVSINTHHIQEFVGISKEYNLFELQRAVAHRDVARVTRIQRYFAANSTKNPFVLTLTSLYGFFSKVFMLHSLPGKSEQEIVTLLGLKSTWQLKEYRVAAGNYPLPQTLRILGLLRQFDLRSKGIDYDTSANPEAEQMKELFFLILH